MAFLFPGMDPYIEASGLWEDFHGKLIGEIERTLAPLVPDRYVVRTGERAYVVMASQDGVTEHSMLPDVAVITPRSRPRRTKRSNGLAVAERPMTADGPQTMRALVETEFRETFIEIQQLKPHRRLVTSIEVLSPSNKRENSPGWAQYLRKRQSLLSGHANLVEIDLLRGGERMPMEDDWPESPYYLLVARRKEAPRCKVWAAHFRTPLPEIPVPLAPPDHDISLALQPLVEAVYFRSRYGQDINYRSPLRPAPSPDDAAWLKKHSRDHERR